MRKKPRRATHFEVPTWGNEIQKCIRIADSETRFLQYINDTFKSTDDRAVVAKAYQHTKAQLPSGDAKLKCARVSFLILILYCNVRDIDVLITTLLFPLAKDKETWEANDASVRRIFCQSSSRVLLWLSVLSTSHYNSEIRDPARIELAYAATQMIVTGEEKAVRKHILHFAEAALRDGLCPAREVVSMAKRSR